MRQRLLWLAMLCILLARASFAQQHYFVDGYHGGIYGHYPAGYTQFMVKQLYEHPYWKIGLEIEPETWDTVRLREPEAYAELKRMLADQSAQGRIEYLNPAYGQGYLFNISGESVIRQFSYGMKKLKTHFPGIVFDTYSSEEPCFTSALPQLLHSFGFRYASLKNPNTCWGGYTRAFGGEVVYWQGPDGTRILTSPRYASEDLAPKSTWQTTAWNNGPAYIQSASAAGIANPVGMCLQDAGWRNGPWLKNNAKYITWRDYMSRIADKKNAIVWPLSQEDIQVSLVWGAQVLQRIGQQVRHAENNIVAAEKYAALRYLLEKSLWPQAAFDSAWTALLLAQHHDCWIVPYNNVSRRESWADKVKYWTAVTNATAEKQFAAATGQYLRVVNTTAFPRNEWVRVPFPTATPVRITDSQGKQVRVRRQADGTTWFKATAPSAGFSSYKVEETAAVTAAKRTLLILPGGRRRFTTDLYEMDIDPTRGGVITSLIIRQLGGRQLVDTAHARGFNELRGYNYETSSWRSSMDTAASITVTDDNSDRITLEIKGQFDNHPFTQTITLASAEPRIDMQVKIDWKGQPRIGAYSQDVRYVAEERPKAFYNDSFKLQAMFPLQLSGQQLTKDAPFDVTVSRLPNTFFNSWDSIKNNIILHWIDITDAGKTAGMAIFSDHTTSYVHGEKHPPGLTLQYAGRGLWGRQYKVDGPTIVNYAIVPHRGDWQTGGIANEEARWCEPLTVVPADKMGEFSLLSLQQPGWQVTSMVMDGEDLLLRLYNVSRNQQQRLLVHGMMDAAMLEELDGQRREPLKMIRQGNNTVLNISAPTFGVRTLRLKKLQVKS